MRRTLLALGFVLLGTSALAAFPARVAGSYRLVPNEATRRFCRRHRIELPVGRLVLREDRTFRLTVTDDEGVQRTLGTYDVTDDHLTFYVEEGDGYDLPSDMRLDEAGLSGRDTSYEREIEVTRRSAPVIEERAPAVIAPKADPRFESGRHQGSIVGTWTLHRKTGEDGSTKFVFSDNGTFRYVGQTTSSRGRWEITDGGIELTWTEIDGEAVERGTRIRKCLPFAFGSEAFYVDDYRYERAGR